MPRKAFPGVSCATCGYHDARSGTCRNRDPWMLPDGRTAGFPSVRPTDWCGVWCSTLHVRKHFETLGAVSQKGKLRALEP